MKRHSFILVVAGVLGLGCSSTPTGIDARDADTAVETGTDLAVESRPDAMPDTAPDSSFDVVLADKTPATSTDGPDAGDADDATAATDAKPDGIDAGPEACPLTCGAEQYCRYTYATDAGCGMAPSGGAWTCVSFPPTCAGTGPSCTCLSCACCKMVGVFAFTCAGV